MRHSRTNLALAVPAPPPPAATEAADTTARGPHGPVDAKAASGANGSPTPALTRPPAPHHPAGTANLRSAEDAGRIRRPSRPGR